MGERMGGCATKWLLLVCILFAHSALSQTATTATGSNSGATANITAGLRTTAASTALGSTTGASTTAVATVPQPQINITSANPVNLLTARFGMVSASWGDRVCFLGGSSAAQPECFRRGQSYYQETTGAAGFASGAAAAAALGRVAVGGGVTQSRLSEQVVIFDICDPGGPKDIVFLSEARQYLQAAGSTTTDKVFFGGGINDAGNYSAVVDAVTLTASSSAVVGLSPLSIGRAHLAVATASNGTQEFVFFAGGIISISNTSTESVDVYDAQSGNKLNNSNSLSIARGNLAGAGVGSYAVFAGGQTSDGFFSDRIDIFDVQIVVGTAFSHSILTLSSPRRFIASAALWPIILFAGGEQNITGSATSAIDLISLNNSPSISSSNVALPSPLWLASGGAGLDGFFYVAGGQNNTAFVSETVSIFQSDEGTVSFFCPGNTTGVDRTSASTAILGAATTGITAVLSTSAVTSTNVIASTASAPSNNSGSSSDLLLGFGLLYVIIAAAVIFVLCLVLIVGIVCCVKRSKRQKSFISSDEENYTAVSTEMTPPPPVNDVDDDGYDAGDPLSFTGGFSTPAPPPAVFDDESVEEGNIEMAVVLSNDGSNEYNEPAFVGDAVVAGGPPAVPVKDFEIPRGTVGEEWMTTASVIELGEEIGRGSYGVVLSGKWKDNQAAIKLARTKEGSTDLIDLDDSHLEVFANEGRIMANITQHKNIIALFAVATDPYAALIMEMMPNGDAWDYQRKHGRFPRATLLDIVLGFTVGLHHVHRHRIIHRDIAARNILLDADLTPKLSDFGTSVALEDGQNEYIDSAPQDDSEADALHHSAPECLNKRIYGLESDVWAYGVTLFELFSATIPHKGMPAVQVAMAVAGSGLRPMLPEAIKQEHPLAQVLIDYAMAKDKAERPDPVLRASPQRSSEKTLPILAENPVPTGEAGTFAGAITAPEASTYYANKLFAFSMDLPPPPQLDVFDIASLPPPPPELLEHAASISSSSSSSTAQVDQNNVNRNSSADTKSVLPVLTGNTGGASLAGEFEGLRVSPDFVANKHSSLQELQNVQFESVIARMYKESGKMEVVPSNGNNLPLFSACMRPEQFRARRLPTDEARKKYDRENVLEIRFLKARLLLSQIGDFSSSASSIGSNSSPVKHDVSSLPIKSVNDQFPDALILCDDANAGALILAWQTALSNLPAYPSSFDRQEKPVYNATSCDANVASVTNKGRSQTPWIPATIRLDGGKIVCTAKAPLELSSAAATTSKTDGTQIFSLWRASKLYANDVAREIRLVGGLEAHRIRISDEKVFCEWRHAVQCWHEFEIGRPSTREQIAHVGAALLSKRGSIASGSLGGTPPPRDKRRSVDQVPPLRKAASFVNGVPGAAERSRRANSVSHSMSRSSGARFHAASLDSEAVGRFKEIAKAKFLEQSQKEGPSPSSTWINALGRNPTKRELLVQEVVATEEKFASQLRSLINGYRDPLRTASLSKKRIIEPQDVLRIFGTTLDVLLNVSEELIQNLRERVSAWDENAGIGDIFLKTIPFFRAYRDYCVEFPAAQGHLAKVRAEKTGVNEFLLKRREEPASHNLDVSDLLITPIQRLPRYVLFLADIYQETPDEHPDFKSISEAYLAMRTVCDEQNARMKESEESLHLALLAEQYEDGADLLKAGRKLMEHVTNTSAIDHKGKTFAGCIFLFNDALIFACEKKGGPTIKQATLPLDKLVVVPQGWSTGSKADKKADNDPRAVVVQLADSSKKELRFVFADAVSCSKFRSRLTEVRKECIRTVRAKANAPPTIGKQEGARAVGSDTRIAIGRASSTGVLP